MIGGLSVATYGDLPGWRLGLGCTRWVILECGGLDAALFRCGLTQRQVTEVEFGG